MMPAEMSTEMPAEMSHTYVADIQEATYNIKHIKQFTNSINQNIITDTKTPIHQNNLGTELFLSQI